MSGIVSTDSEWVGFAGTGTWYGWGLDTPCSWCGESIASGATVGIVQYCGKFWDDNVYHPECWDVVSELDESEAADCEYQHMVRGRREMQARWRGSP